MILITSDSELPDFSLKKSVFVSLHNSELYWKTFILYLIVYKESSSKKVN